MLIDDAIELARSLSSSFSQAVAFALLPQHHGSIETTTVISHRRLMEDRLMASLGFDSSQHCCYAMLCYDLPNLATMDVSNT